MSNLILIYHFQSSYNSSLGVGARYKVVFFFSSAGFLDQNMLIEMAKTVPEAGHFDLTFLNLDDLKEFALRVAQEMQVPQVRIISVQDYNIGLDGAKDVTEFKLIFSKFGDLLVNQAEAKKKGFLGKFFN